MSEFAVLQGPIHTPNPPTHTQRGPFYCLSRAGSSPLQASPPGPLLKYIIVWAELVGSSESPSESHTEFVFVHESHSRLFLLYLTWKLPSSRGTGDKQSCLLCISSFLEHRSFKGCLQANISQFVFKLKLYANFFHGYCVFSLISM